MLDPRVRVPVSKFQRVGPFEQTNHAANLAHSFSCNARNARTCTVHGESGLATSLPIHLALTSSTLSPCASTNGRWSGSPSSQENSPMSLKLAPSPPTCLTIYGIPSESRIFLAFSHTTQSGLVYTVQFT